MTENSFFGIQFTRSGWKQFCRVNRTLACNMLSGIRFIRAYVLKRELAVYLTAHEAAGIHMDSECQELRYDDGIYLILRREQGIWYITDVILANVPDTFLPVYTVRNRLRRAGVVRCDRQATYRKGGGSIDLNGWQKIA